MYSISCPLSDIFFSFWFSEIKFINSFKNVKQYNTAKWLNKNSQKITESKVIGFPLKVLHLYWLSGYASSHSKWMWMMQPKSWMIQQGICHSRLLLGFVCTARTCQNKDSPPGDRKLPWASTCCCILSVVFDWGIWLLLAALLQITLAGCHGITGSLRGRH